MAEDAPPMLSTQQQKLVQDVITKARGEELFLHAPSPEDFVLIYAAVAQDLAQLNPISNPDPATIPNPIVRKIFEDTRHDMVKHFAGRYALDGEIAALRDAAQGPENQQACLKAATTRLGT